MNNKLATEIRDYGMNRVFEGIDFSELIQIDSGKFVFPLDYGDKLYYCEVENTRNLIQGGAHRDGWGANHTAFSEGLNPRNPIHEYNWEPLHR